MVSVCISVCSSEALGLSVHSHSSLLQLLAYAATSLEARKLAEPSFYPPQPPIIQGISPPMALLTPESQAEKEAASGQTQETSEDMQ